jgi:cardiolipin synthase A/B
MALRWPLPITLLTAAVVVAVLAGGGGLAAKAAAGGRGPAAAAMAAASGPPLQLVVEPQAGNAPFLAMIDAARHSVELTMYELYDTQIEAALAGAARRGVDVRVLLNGGYYSERWSDNAGAFAYLKSRGVDVRYTPAYFALTHQKTLTVDGDESAVMTLNFDGGYATTRDFAVLDRQPADVRAIVSAFDADWSGRQITPLSGSGDLVWSPGAESAVLALIGSARFSIDVENEEMDYQPATEALCAAARRGVEVEVVMSYESEWKRALSQLSACGAKVRLYYGQRYYIHAKLLLVDGRTALISSQNLSTTSLEYNRELGIEVRSGVVVSQLRRDFASDYEGGSSSRSARPRPTDVRRRLRGPACHLLRARPVSRLRAPRSAMRSRPRAGPGRALASSASAAAALGT